MQQTKFTFSNSSNSYSISKASQPLPNQPKPIPTINFSSVHKTSKNHQDQHHNLSSNIYHYNSPGTFDHNVSGKEVAQYRNIDKEHNNSLSITKIQNQLYKKEEENQHLFSSADAFPKILKHTIVNKQKKAKEVNPFKIDTSDFQTVKGKEFIGCFQCFSSVKYKANQSK